MKMLSRMQVKTETNVSKHQKHSRMSNRENSTRTTVLSFSNFLIVLCLVTLLSLPVRAMPNPAAEITVTPEKLAQGSFTVKLPFGFQLFGDGVFDTAFINNVGAVSFAAPVTTSDVESVKTRSLLFAPLLLSPTSVEGIPQIVARYRTSVTEDERLDLVEKFREKIDASIVVTKVFVIKFEELPEGNSFEITFVGNEDKTFVRYSYHRITRVQDENGYAMGGFFAFEDGAIFCGEKIPDSGSSALEASIQEHLGIENSKYWNVDLPLKCTTFEAGCKDRPENSEESINAKFQGSFLKTHTETTWSTYALYYCNQNHKKPDGTINVRQGCVYDPDYYTYSWLELTAIDHCLPSDT